MPQAMGSAHVYMHVWGRAFGAICRAVLEKGNLLLVLQIGNLDDYYHFYHSKTFKRSTLSSRGPHTFLRMDPQVHAGRVPSKGLECLALPS